MFIRKKIIKGHEYWYLVENKWIGKSSRQKVIRYLGKRECFNLGDVVAEIAKSKPARDDKNDSENVY